MLRMKLQYIILAAACLPMAGCGHKQSAATARTGATMPVTERRTGSEAMIPKATVFRMSGDYADKVAVTMDSEGRLLYYPAPSDITQYSAPVSLGDGWWLNRQGLGPESVFTRWTFAEYAALPSTPATEEIVAAVIPGSKVTEYRILPVTASEAMDNPQICVKYL